MSRTVTHQFAEGELVDVHIKGARVVDNPTASLLPLPSVRVCVENQFGDWDIDVPTSYPGVNIARVAPAEWPPQVADTWAVQLFDGGGREYFATGLHGKIRMRAADDLGDAWVTPDDLLDAGPVRLVRRRNWTPPTDTAPAAPEPEQVDRRAAVIAGAREFADLLEARPDLDLGYMGAFGPLVRSMQALRAWAQVLGVEIKSSTSNDTVHHTVKGRLAGLEVSPFWLEDLPKPKPASAPLPHRVPDEQRQTSTPAPLPELRQTIEGSVTVWSVTEAGTTVSVEMVPSVPVHQFNVPTTTDSRGVDWAVTGLYFEEAAEPATQTTCATAHRDAFVRQLGDGWTEQQLRAQLTGELRGQVTS